MDDLIDIDPTWKNRAACRGVDPALFYPSLRDPDQNGTRAKQICATCPVTATCLEHALTTGELEGIWGGTSPKERQRIRRTRRRHLVLVEAQ